MAKVDLTCYHPKPAIIEYSKVDEKKHVTFISRSVFDAYQRHALVLPPGQELVEIPCGECVGCRMKYAYGWANRLMLELKCHDPNKCFFVTLTYSPEYIDRCRPAADPNTGEVIPDLWSLEKKDLQDFMKRLRRELNLCYMTPSGEYIKRSDFNGQPVILYKRGKRKGQPKEFYKTEDNIRFYACGEYGSKNHRCHFHLILFNVNFPVNDLQFLKKSNIGNDYWTSQTLCKVWPYGYNVVASVTWESCSYTARYMLKKQKGENNYVYSDFGIAPPFAVCSRKPGIAKPYFESLEDFGSVSSFVVGSDRKVRKFAPPAYFERLYAEDHPEEAEKRKQDRRKYAVEKQRMILAKTDKDIDSYLQDCENILAEKDKVLYNYRSL